MKIIDLFAGCCGLSLGFQNAGFEIVAAFDNWQPAIDIYKLNFLHPILKLDLSANNDFNIFKAYEPDMIIGGPPCQDFSSAGKRNESERADLTIKLGCKMFAFMILATILVASFEGSSTYKVTLDSSPS